jgi:hypothetical protein
MGLTLTGALNEKSLYHPHSSPLFSSGLGLWI